MGIFDHSSISAFVKSDTDDEKAWLAVSALIHPKGILLGWHQDSVQASQVPPHQIRSSIMDLALCTSAQSFWDRKETASTKLGACNCRKSLGIPKHSDFLSLELRGQAKLLKKKPHIIIPPSTKLYTWHNAVRQVPFSWQPPNSDIHQIARWRSVIRRSRERVPTALESSGGVLYTTASNVLHCTWWCMAWMQLLGHGKPFHEALYTLFFS